jgi:hypothetical protein
MKNLNRSFLLDVIARVQRHGGVGAYVDTTKTVTADELRTAGVKVEEVLTSHPDTDHQAVEITETLLRSGSVDVVVLETRAWIGAHFAKVGGGIAAFKAAGRKAVIDDEPCVCGAPDDSMPGGTDGDCRSNGCNPLCLPCNATH